MRTAAVIVLSSLLLAGCFCPGGPGGGQLLAPATAKAGEPVNVSLRAFVLSSRSMCGGPAVDRFKSVVAYYWLEGETNYHVLTPAKTTVQDREHVLFDFVIPPQASGELEVLFGYHFDGRYYRDTSVAVKLI